MTPKAWLAGAVALWLAAPAAAGAGEVKLFIKDGRVALVARDATLREILIEWERVGGTRIVNRDRVPGTRLNLEMADVPESQALATLLRPIAGYMAARRLEPDGGSSGFSRIILMPGEAAPFSVGGAQAAAAPPQGMGGSVAGRPGMQRRVLPDGRVVTVMDDPSRMSEDEAPDDPPPGPANQPGMMRPPFGAPGARMQGPGGTPQPDDPVERPATAPSSLPTAPVGLPVPGLLPTSKPPAAPPKPPGD
jgi:hypothetical protein